MKTTRPFLFFFFVLVVSAIFSAMSHGIEAFPVQIQTHVSHTRLTIQVDEGVPAVWKGTEKGFEVLLKGISFIDLGSARGTESILRKKVADYGDQRVGSIDIQESPEGLKITGRWKFPTGAAALAEPVMEAFEYRIKSPASYIVDFWVKKGPTISEVKVMHAQERRLATVKTAEENKKKKTQQRINEQQIRAEKEDSVRFCKRPLSEKSDIFLSFLPAHETFQLSKWLPTTTPDRDFRYFEPKAKTADAQYVRVALELRNQGKAALTNRTIEFFEKEHPDSQYRHEMRFLKANVLIQLGMQKEAEEILQHLTLDAKDTPVGLYSAMYLATKRFNEGSHIASLESFMWLINEHPQHQLIWVFHMGAAESLFMLKQTDRAAKEYEWVIENATSPKEKAQAAIRMGDLYLDRLQHDQALAAYFRTLSHFEKEATEHPTLYINRAEALYWLAQYDRASEAFREFLDKYNNHPMGWRATYRLGEIEGRKENNLDASRKWFLETVNRYPFSAGATLARLRLIPCDDQASTDRSLQDRFFETDAAQFDGKGEVSTQGYLDYRSLAQIRAMMSSGREDVALTFALKEMLNPRRAEVTRVLKSQIVILLKKYVHKLVSEGKKYEALSYYNTNIKIIPKSDDPVEADYLLTLSRAASDLGLGKMAMSLVETYKKETAANASVRTPAADKNANDLEKSFRSSEQNFSQAKALWISDSVKNEEKIREHLTLVVEESRFSFGKELMLSLLEDRANRATYALQHALRAQLLMPPNRSKDEEARVTYWLAQLELKANNDTIALQMYQNLENIIKDATLEGSNFAKVIGLPSVPEEKVIIMKQAELLEKQSRWGEAATTYARATEKGIGGNEMLFSYARALMRTGEKTSKLKATAALKRISESKVDDFWKKLAREALVKEGAREGRP
jgi:tetratricopeptide (TPR) repeat protein